MEDEPRRLQSVTFDPGRQSTLRYPVTSAAEVIELTPPPPHALIGLDRESSVTMGEFATLAGVTGIVDRFEHEDDLARQRSDTGRRLARFYPTSKAKEPWRGPDARFIAKASAPSSLPDADGRATLFQIMERLPLRFGGPQSPARSKS